MATEERRRAGFAAGLLGLLAAGALALPAAAGDGLVRTRLHEEHGEVLIGSDGRTLYTFDRDGVGSVRCTGGCAVDWPPLLAGATHRRALLPPLGLLRRPDDGVQVTHEGRPLYRCARDRQPGEARCHGRAGLWSVARP